MKAKNENGTITFYDKMPSQYQSEMLNIAGGFDKMAVQIHQQEGFYDVVTPEFDNEIEQLGDIYLDENLSVYTYPVINQVIDLVVEKTQRKAELKDNVDRLISEALSVGVLEKLVLGEVIPQSYKDTVLYLRGWETQTIADIDAMTDPQIMRKYKIKQEDVEQSKEILKAGRNL